MPTPGLPGSLVQALDVDDARLEALFGAAFRRAPSDRDLSAINAAFIEIKDAAYIARTKQVRIQTGAAKASGRESHLVTGEKTRISKQAIEAFDIIQRRSDLGPR